MIFFPEPAYSEFKKIKYTHLWYNRIARLYDAFADLPYRKVRAHAISALDITPGDTIIDLGCGTGLNLKALSQAVGHHGTVIAIEPSYPMLKQAKNKAAHHNLNNIQWFQTGISDYINTHGLPNTDNLKIIITLVVSVIPDWESTLSKLLHAMPQGSKLVIMDLYAEQQNIFSSFINLIAQADIHRTSWKPLTHTLTHTTLTWHDMPYYMGIRVFIATGIKTKP